MLILAAVMLAAASIIILLVKNKRSKLPEYLKGSHADRYTDLMTERPVYIAAKKNPETGKCVNEAYYADDGSKCVQALTRQDYGFLYYENGEVKIMHKKLAYELLERIRNVKTYEEKTPGKLSGNIKESDEQ